MRVLLKKQYFQYQFSWHEPEMTALSCIRSRRKKLPNLSGKPEKKKKREKCQHKWITVRYAWVMLKSNYFS